MSGPDGYVRAYRVRKPAQAVRLACYRDPDLFRVYLPYRTAGGERVTVACSSTRFCFAWLQARGQPRARWVLHWRAALAAMARQSW